MNDVYGGPVNALKHPDHPIEVRDDPEILMRLVAAERAWIMFRDAECSYMLQGTGESGAGSAYALNLYRRVRSSRVKLTRCATALLFLKKSAYQL